MNAALAPEWIAAITFREELLGRDTLSRMAALYLEELDHLVSSVSVALDSGDLVTARKRAHHLAASAGALDFVSLLDAVQLVETRCVLGDLAGARKAWTCGQLAARESAGLLRSHYGLA
jgi:HPt (histidine-containing phosphotransfer) domain-containing protein